MNSKVIVLCSLVSISTFLSGCGSRMASNQRNFILDISRNRPQQEISKDVILEVQSFSIDTAFSTQSFVYRKGQSEYERDFYNQFLIQPEGMITEKTRSWLSESGLFKVVLEPESYADATHVLEGNIITLFGDFSNGSLPQANIKMRFFLLKLPEKSIVFAKTYDVESEIESRTAESLIKAFEECLVKILSDLEHDLQEKL